MPDSPLTVCDQDDIPGTKYHQWLAPRT